MLDQCTHRLEMNKAARRLYTADGMIILDINDLVEWVKDKYVEQVTAERRAVKHEEKRKMKEKGECLINPFMPGDIFNKCRLDI